MSVRSARSNAFGMIFLGIAALVIGLSLNPGFRPVGFVPSVWPYLVFLSGAALVIIGLFYLARTFFWT